MSIVFVGAISLIFHGVIRRTIGEDSNGKDGTKSIYRGPEMSRTPLSPSSSITLVLYFTVSTNPPTDSNLDAPERDLPPSAVHLDSGKRHGRAFYLCPEQSRLEGVATKGHESQKGRRGFELLENLGIVCHLPESTEKRMVSLEKFVTPLSTLIYFWTPLPLHISFTVFSACTLHIPERRFVRTKFRNAKVTISDLYFCCSTILSSDQQAPNC